MARALIVYFSHGGTTRRVGAQIAAGLGNGGYEVDLHNLRDGPPSAVDGYDLLGVGSPVYYYRPPFNVADYLKSLPPLRGLPTFVFVLHGTYRGDTGTVIQRVLQRRGARNVGFFHAYGADLPIMYLKKGYFFSPDQPTVDELARAGEFGRLVAERTASRVNVPLAVEPHAGPVYRLEQIACHRWLVQHVYSRLFRSDPARCKGCATCVMTCPTGNIAKDKNGRPVWGRDCLVCGMCQSHCPQEAISSPLTWPMFDPFILYNVSHAARDPNLEWVRVVLRRGRVERLDVGKGSTPGATST